MGEKEEKKNPLTSGVVSGTLSAQSDKWIIERFEGIAESLMSLGFYKLGIDLTKRIDGMGEDIQNRNSFYYYQSQFYFFSEDYIDSVDVCNKVLSQDGLSLSTEICFEYIKAESFFRLQENEKAYRIFKKISCLDPSYRLSQERVRFLEENK